MKFFVGWKCYLIFLLGRACALSFFFVFPVGYFLQFYLLSSGSWFILTVLSLEMLLSLAQCLLIS